MKKEIKWIIITTSIMLMLSKTEIAAPVFDAFDNIIFNIAGAPVAPVSLELPKLSGTDPDFNPTRKNYTAVTSYEEWLWAINGAKASMAPTLNLKIKNYNEDIYNLKNISVNGIRTSCQGRLVGKTAFLTYSFEYGPNAKILAAYSDLSLRELLNERELAALNKAYAIAEEITTPEMSDYEKELALHDYIVAKATYDEEALKTSVDTDNIWDEAHCITGLLLDNKGVCEAYANTFLLLCKIVGVECHLANGDTTEQLPGIENSKHQWNIVKLDNEYYNVDLTFDDPLPSVEGRVLHTYFNLSDEELSKTHIIEEHNFVCTGTKYNYFNYNNLNVSSNGEMLALLRSKLDQGIREITFKTCNGYRISSMEEFYPAAENRGLNRIALSGELGIEGIYCVTFE